MGAGLAYLTNPYNRDTNRKNNIASSFLNATLQLRFEYDYALTPHLGLLAGLGLNHYSNGATTKPNFGVNLPSVVLGLNYHEQRAAPRTNANAPDPAEVGGYFFNLSSSLGYKQRNGSDPKNTSCTRPPPPWAGASTANPTCWRAWKASTTGR
ncbi:acyloxyacyl hydrolase [Hymenobacter humi]|uniref:Acyloxyacyl hydrolase n=1 Tax=Hymenobacter humi TaxID=1411620 RepID=A0ABW2U143_9BACT